MRTKMIRNIHPIGQGGFISEYFVDNAITIVYDCGTSSKIGSLKGINALFNSCFSTDEIECLFISHFDEDHISLIPNLLNRRKVKKVVIPLISESIKNQITVTFESRELANILVNPRQSFGESTQIIQVRELNPEDNSSNTERNLDNISGETCRSGEGFNIGESEWEYIFFNIKSQERHLSFIELCENRLYNIDVEKLDDLNYIIGKKDKLKEIYKQIPGGINQNSLIVYSGTRSDYFLENISWVPWRFERYYPSCLFMGDYDCTHLDQIKRMLNPNRLKTIGSIQIPHHGAKANWSDELLFENCHNFFTQCGSHNDYGHPATCVLNAIYAYNPFNNINIVNENSSTYLSQCVIDRRS
jgi:beta-lactamase superfamily II metal-dependent hydrolase